MKALSRAVFRVLIADDVSPECRGLFSDDERFEVVEEKLRGEALIEGIADFDGLIVRSGCKVSADVLKNATRLRAVVRAGVGVDNIDLTAATRCGVLVMNTPEGNTVSAAEHTLAMMLALSRNIAPADSAVRGGGWRSKAFLGSELRGKTLAVVGLGKIGREVATRARGFGMKIQGFDPMLAEEAARALGIELRGLEELFADADYLTVHVPLTPKTRHLVDASVLARVKPGLRIVNCARGGIIDEGALCDALSEGRIAGAALDVFEQEPLPAGHRLLSCPRLLLTPHLGASTFEAQESVGVMSGRQLKAFLSSGEIKNAVNTLALDAAELERVGPHLELARHLGSIHAQLEGGAPKRLSVSCAGEIYEGGSGLAPRLKVVTLAVLEGYFKHYLNAPVNRVSVPHFAREHGLTIEERKSSDAKGYESLIEVVVETSEGRHSLSATSFGELGLRLVSFDGYSLDSKPEGVLLMFKNYDLPGMLGQVCTTIGGASVNIANVNLGRNESGGTALAAMNLDCALPGAALAELASMEGIPWVRQVTL